MKPARRTGLAALPLLMLATAGLPAAAEDAVRGKALYESRCAGCHSIEANRVGPKHAGVFGRKAGGVSDFDYSPALQRSKVIWNSQTLEKWLRDPEALIPGQAMGYSVAEQKDRLDLIAYLRKESGR